MGVVVGKRSVLHYKNFKIHSQVFLLFILFCAARISYCATNTNDVAAINRLYAALGLPKLPGWVQSGGDPCGEAWQGVICNTSNFIESITLNAVNLGGVLGDSLGMFDGIITLDLSNNQIGGSIPANLPATLQNLFLSANQFSGNIPNPVSPLVVLSAMSLNNNLLTGEITDSFQNLPALVNLDLSFNNMSGQLPPSLASLSSLSTLHVQNNQLSGNLDVLEDLPLTDLNVENNLFSGAIPDKLMNIPTFKKDGNAFDTTATPIPSPTASIMPPPSPTPPFWGTPSPPQSPAKQSPPGKQTPGKRADAPSSPKGSSSGKSGKFLTTKKLIWISVAAAFLLVILALACLLFMPRCSRRRERVDGTSKPHQVGAYRTNRDNNLSDGGSLVPPPINPIEKAPKDAGPKADRHQVPAIRTEAIPKIQKEREGNMPRFSIPKQDDYEIDMSEISMSLMPPPPPPLPPPSPSPPPPPPPPPPPVEKVIVNPIAPSEVSIAMPSSRTRSNPISARSFSIASLQQYTNSFSPENLIGGGMLGTVYRAQLPDGKLLAVKKLDKRASSQQKDDEFLELVNSIDLIRHANIVELLGYCAEHSERLLIYEYCSNGTLQDALHSDDEFKNNLSWTNRVRMALGAARALEYLHEICDPPIVHRNFKSSNVLLDEDLSVRVSDCGLATLISSGSVSQLSGHLLSAYGYGAPEFESGIYTIKSDVYSFGVVMLELLTGRKSYDRTRNRGEHFLVRWAIPQLHDIDALSRMVDPSLNGEYPAKSLSHFADIISRCVQSEPEFRPPMSEIVQDITDMIRRERRGSNSD
ncbi:hypothetical protein ACFE04_016801 [Oxalis oulophora]